MEKIKIDDPLDAVAGINIWKCNKIDVILILRKTSSGLTLPEPGTKIFVGLISLKREPSLEHLPRTQACQYDARRGCEGLMGRPLILSPNRTRKRGLIVGSDLA